MRPLSSGFIPRPRGGGPGPQGADSAAPCTCRPAPPRPAARPAEALPSPAGPPGERSRRRRSCVRYGDGVRADALHQDLVVHLQSELLGERRAGGGGWEGRNCGTCGARAGRGAAEGRAGHRPGLQRAAGRPVALP